VCVDTFRNSFLRCWPPQSARFLRTPKQFTMALRNSNGRKRSGCFDVLLGKMTHSYLSTQRSLQRIRNLICVNVMVQRVRAYSPGTTVTEPLLKCVGNIVRVFQSRLDFARAAALHGEYSE